MTRVKRGVSAHRRHHSLVKAAKGFRQLRSRSYKHAKQALMKAGVHSYADRRLRRRDFRRLWITRLNAALRQLGVQYSRFIDAATKKDMLVNRKMLADLAVTEPETFKVIVDTVMKA